MKHVSHTVGLLIVLYNFEHLEKNNCVRVETTSLERDCLLLQEYESCFAITSNHVEDNVVVISSLLRRQILSLILMPLIMMRKDCCNSKY